MIVVQGQYTVLIDGKKIPLRAGEEYFIPRGVLHGGEVLARTTTPSAGPGGAGLGSLRARVRGYHAGVNSGAKYHRFVTNDPPESSIQRVVSPTAPRVLSCPRLLQLRGT
jgi:hypothetical protein